ncbi:MAG: hypothetical protein R3F39_00850 [Myxococcota bacterium]
MKLTTFLTRICLWISRELRRVLQAPVAQKLEQLAVVLVVFGRVDAVVFWVDEVGEEAVGQGHDHHGHGPLSLSPQRVRGGLGQDDRLRAVGVDVGGDDAGRHAPLRVEEAQRHDRPGVDGEAVVVDGPRVQAAGEGRVAEGCSVGRVHLEAVGDRAQVVEELVGVRPLGHRPRLDLVADDAGPLGRVDQQEIRGELGDLGSRPLVGVAQGLVARALVGAEQRVRHARHDEAQDDVRGGRRAHGAAPGRGSSQAATALPVPMTVPYA